ncbi:MAG: fructosamine kinase family protein [Candidatus Sumerlaeia bacterium]|nr:fructosamine kinase family protein [Candidatus Sumerlaeia bacterium]
MTNLDQALEAALGSPPAASRAVGGGCIAEARIVALADGRRIFLKTHPAPPPRFFECEAAGLEALGRAGVLRVPAVLATGPEDAPFLALELVESGQRGPGFHARFGAALNRLHRATSGGAFGFAHDNYIGATPQRNGWMDDWLDFLRERRFLPQLALLERNGLSSRKLRHLTDRLLGRLPELLGESAREPAVLLHGDLWGGNYLVDERGEPVLIDPAAYHGHREMDLAMTQLYGGFPGSFLQGYDEEWPLAPGWRERMPIYQLYHMLNHANLFGAHYLEQALATLAEYS